MARERANSRSPSTSPGGVARSAGAPAGVRMRYWLLAFRPKTLTIAVVPVALGSALAWADTGRLVVAVLLATLSVAVLIQVGTNLYNDATDAARGGDDPETRLGPPRATAQGWLPAAAVKRAAYASFALAFTIGLYLSWWGGWPIFVLGVAAILAGLAYSGGVRPISYSSLGELFVWAFFGLLAVGGTYYLQVGSVSLGAVLGGALIGMPAAAVLVVNNYRDLEADKGVGRRTLAVRLGPGATRREYAALMLMPFALAPWILASARWAWLAWLSWLALPAAAALVARMYREPSGPALNRLLAATAGVQVFLGGLLALAAVLSRVLDGGA